MKKLMIAAVAAATVGGAFAAPIVYDYKASVKHTYLKQGKVKVNNTSTTLYLKTQKTSSLKGYLIQDADGKTTKAQADVQEYNRCYLVVKNGSAEKNYRYVRIVPGILEAKWYANKVLSGSKGSAYAQGYLYLGGDVVTTLAGSMFTSGTDTDNLLANEVTGYSTGSTLRALVDSLEPASPITPTYGIDDYFYTSCYLFGQYNEPDWNYDVSATTASTVLYRYFFADAWMNGAGFGKASYSDSRAACCGRKSGSAGYELNSLSGNLKAGLYLCGLSGSDLYHKSLNRYEDQLWAEQYNALTSAWTADTWADGDLELGTTDVGYGTWSIKLNTKLAGKDIDANDLDDGITMADVTANVYPFIKAAALALDKNVTLFGSPLDGAMINQEFNTAYLK